VSIFLKCKQEHLRSGDTLRLKSNTYGPLVLPFRVYKKIIPNNTKTIGITTAPFKAERSMWGKGDPDLSEALVAAVQSYIQRDFPKKAKVVSIRNDIQEGMDEVHMLDW
jgi:hypothetical protein